MQVKLTVAQEAEQSVVADLPQDQNKMKIDC